MGKAVAFLSGQIWATINRAACHNVPVISKEGGDLGFLWSSVPVSSSKTSQHGRGWAACRPGEWSRPVVRSYR